MQCAWGCGDRTVLAQPPERTGSNTCMNAHKNQNIPLPDVQQTVLHFAEQTSPLHHRQTYQTKATVVLTVHKYTGKSVHVLIPMGHSARAVPPKEPPSAEEANSSPYFLKTAIALLALHRQTPTDSMYFSQSAPWGSPNHTARLRIEHFKLVLPLLKVKHMLHLCAQHDPFREKGTLCPIPTQTSPSEIYLMAEKCTANWKPTPELEEL